MMERGDIVYGKNNLQGGHPILFLEDKDEYSFVGAMLTKSGGYKGNYLMKKEFFRQQDKNGKDFTFRFNSTHIVGRSLLKKVEWEPFEKVGELSNEGLEFVDSILKNQEPVFWEDYLSDDATEENN